MLYPALDIGGIDGEIALAFADDYSPTAVEEHGGFLTIFFSDPKSRDLARDAIVRAFPAARVTSRDVDDEDWARRSQENLGRVTVGRITIAPPWTAYDDASRRPSSGSAWPQALPPTPPARVAVTIQPSMAFGTGHHATTRLCLAALQALDLAGRFVLDIGTGSGVLAIAARKLGARRVHGIDCDPDAVQCARENLMLNSDVDEVTFELADVVAQPWDVARPGNVARPFPASARMTFSRASAFAEASAERRSPGGGRSARLAEAPDARRRQGRRPDVITANLSGALLCRAATTIAARLAPGGSLIISGVRTDERADVVAVFQKLKLAWEQEEEDWVGLVFEDLGERKLEAE